MDLKKFLFGEIFILDKNILHAFSILHNKNFLQGLKKGFIRVCLKKTYISHLIFYSDIENKYKWWNKYCFNNNFDTNAFKLLLEFLSL